MRPAISLPVLTRLLLRPRRTFVWILLCVLAGAHASAQNTYTVTSFTDTQANTLEPGGGFGPGVNAGGNYDLRGALFAAMAAGGSNTINFACATPPCKITLAAPLPPIFELATTGAQAISSFSLTIDGGTQRNVVIDGASLYRPFWVDNVAVVFKNLVIQNGLAKGGNAGPGAGGGAGFGGGIFVNQATAVVTVLNTLILNCRAVGGDAYGSGSFFSIAVGSFTSGAGGGGGMGYDANNGGGGGIAGAATSDGNGGAGGGGGGLGKLGGSAYAANDPGTSSSTDPGNGGFGGGGGGVPNWPSSYAFFPNGRGGFGGGGAGLSPGGAGGFGGGNGLYYKGGNEDVRGIRGGDGNDTLGVGGSGAAAGPGIFVVSGAVTLVNSTGSGFSASPGGGAPFSNLIGTTDSTGVFNYGGQVNHSPARGAIADAFSPGLPVGQSTGTQEVRVSFTRAVQTTDTFTINVLTQGATGQDFTYVGGGSCSSGTAYAVGATCTVQYNFKPAYPGVRMGAVTITSPGAVSSTNPAGTVASTLLTGIGTGPQVAFAPGTLSSGGGSFSSPYAVAVDSSGSTYITESSNFVKKMTAGCTSFSCVTVIGGGFSNPSGVAVDGAGNVYVADTGNKLVKKIPVGCVNTGCVITMGGGFGNVGGVAVDSGGEVVVTDFSANTALMMQPDCTSASCVKTLAGGFNMPLGVAVDATGNVYVADTNDNAVKEIPVGCASSNCVVTLGGGFSHPSGVSVDSNGTVYVGDSFNGAVKAIPAGCSSSSCVIKITAVSDPVGVALDGAGNLYIGGGLGATLPILNRTSGSLTFATTTGSGTTDTVDGPQTATLTNIGNAPLYFAIPKSPATNPTAALDFSFTGVGANACPLLTSSASSRGLLAAGSTCSLPVTFTPRATSNGTLSESMVFTDNHLNNGNGTGVTGDPSTATQTLTLTGTTGPTPTITNVSPNSGALPGGTLVTITGSGFSSGNTSLTVGSTLVPANSVNVVSPTSLTFSTPAGTAGTVDIVVKTNGISSAITAADHFTYSGPSIAAVVPNSGAIAGGTTVTLTGLAFSAGATSITIGSTTIPAANVSVTSSSTLSFVAPAHAVGIVDIVANASGLSSAITAADQFTYVATPVVTGVSPATGPATGGTLVTVTGQQFVGGGTSVTMGGTTIPAANVSVNSATSLSFTTPPGAVGVTDIVLTSSAGASKVSAADQFLYQSGPTLTSISPVGGIATGGTTVTLTGQNLLGATSVTFGGTPATSFSVVNASTATAVTPSHAVGAVDVRLTNAISSATLTNGFRYTGASSYLVSTSTDDATAVATHCTLGAGDNTGSNSACSFRDAVAAANLFGSQATISFWSGLDGLSAATAASPAVLSVHTGGTITISGNVLISGPVDSNGKSVLAIDGGGSSMLHTTGTASLSNLIVRNGSTGITNDGATTLTGITLSGHQHTALQTNQGTVELANCNFSANNTDYSGYNGSALTLLGGVANISNSTIFGNVGFPVSVTNTALTITSSTLTGNTEPVMIMQSGSATFLQSTFTGNISPYGTADHTFPGIYTVPGVSTIKLYNSIFTEGMQLDPTTTFVDGGGNIRDYSLVNLSSLADHGGLTQTMVPLPGSSALCASPTTISGITIPTTDQRGLTTATNGCTGGKLDAGSVQTNYGIGFTTEPPSTFPAGAPVTPAPAVQLLDNGYAISGSGVSVNLTSSGALLSSGGGTLLTDNSGAATYSSLIFNRPPSLGGTQLRLSATASVTIAGTPQILSATSTPFNVGDPLPAVTSISPASGAVGGGNTVTIYGSGFYDSPTVTFGTTSVAGNALSGGSLVATVPPGAAGTVDVTVTTPGGTSAVSSGSHYTYTSAAPYLVTTLVDDAVGTASNCVAYAADDSNGNNACSLRDAIAAATATTVAGTQNVVSFWSGIAALASATRLVPAVYSVTAGGTLNISGAITINGPTSGSGATLTNLLAIDGGGSVQVFNLTGAASLNNLTVRNGYSSNMGGNIYSVGTSLTLNQVTLTGGHADRIGGGLYAGSGGIITNSTISDNAADGNLGGGIFAGSGVVISNSTIVNNTSAIRGGGLYGGPLTLINSTLSGNTSGLDGTGVNFLGTTSVVSNNILTDSTVGTYTGANNITSTTNLNLAAPAYNGGPTQTRLPLPGSTAICAGSSSAAGISSTDQRGLPHSSQYCATGQVDAGAVQTNYGLAFSTQPVSIYLGTIMSPGPAVQVNESSVPYAASGLALTLSDANGALASGNTGGSTGVGGAYTFGALSFSSAQSADTITAFLPLSIVAGSSSSTLSVQSNSFDVIAPMTLNGSFAGAPSTVGVGQNLTYRLQIGNANPSATLSGASVTVILPSGLQFVSGAGTVCGSAVASASASSIAVANIALAASATCQVALTLQATNLGVQTVSASSALARSTASTAITVALTAPVISWVPTVTQLHNGQALSTGVLNATSTVPGTFTYTAALQLTATPVAVTASSVLPSGAYVLTATFTPTSAAYTTSTAVATVTIVGNDVFTAGSGVVGALYNTGGVLSAATPGGGIGAAVDANGNVWSIDSGGIGLAQFSSLGVLVNDFRNLALSGATALAVDGNNNLLVTNGDGSLVVISVTGAVLSTTQGSTAVPAAALTIDNSGNIWNTNTAANTVDEIIGGAAPVAPLTNAVQSNTLGVKP